MGVIIDFFKTVFKSVGSLIMWVVGLPALIASSIVGLVTAVKGMLNIFYQPVNSLQQGLSSASSFIQQVTNYVNQLPDYIQNIFYCLSFDVLVSHVVETFTLVISVTYVYLVFVVISIPTYLIGLLTLKYSARIYSAFVSQAYVPSIVNWIADIEIPINKVMLYYASKLFNSKA